jgi:hypothetical protein
MIMEDQNQKREENIARNNFFTDFYNSRTPLWRGMLFVILESVIPGIAVYLLVGIDVSNTSMADKLPSPHVGYAALISICYIIFVIGLTSALFFLKAHKSDNFTYSTTIAIIFAALVMLSYGLTKNNITFIFVKFIISFVLIILGGIAGVFLTTVFSNFNYKKEDEVKDVNSKKASGEKLSKKEERLLARTEKENQRKEEERKRSAEIKKRLDAKLDKIIQDQEKEKD